MNSDIAIQFEKINVGDGLCFFKPVGIVKGEYEQETEQFITDFGSILLNVTESEYEADGYFNFVSNIKKLKRNVPEQNIDNLLSDYFEMCLYNLYVGMYDFSSDLTKLVQIPLDELQNAIADPELEPCITLSHTELKNLKEVSSLKEIREILDGYLSMFRGEPEPQITKKTNYKVDKKASKKMDLAKLRKKVNSIIINQDKAVDDVTRAIMINETSINPNHKSHILVVGPSGTGKTKMVDIISKEMDLPYFVADATAYTEEGYVGKSVYSMIEGLIISANGDIEKAQKGLLVIDEIDKKITKREDDPAGQKVLHSLLKILDRGTIEIDLGSGFDSRKVLFDTSNLTVICMGAFEGLYKNKLTNNKSTVGPIGFNPVYKEPIKQDNIEITRQDLIDFGMPAEFLGRIGTVTYTDKLSEEDLICILNKSKESPLKEEKEYFKNLGINISFSQGYKIAIAKNAIKANTGARNLRSEVKDSLKKVYDDVLINNKVKKLTITQDILNDNKKYSAK